MSAGRFSNTLIGLADAKSKEIAEALIGDRALGGQDPIQAILDYRPRPVREIGQLKAPALTNAFDNAVYFHDGSVDNLKAAISRINRLLGLSLTDDDVNALEAYVTTL